MLTDDELDQVCDVLIEHEGLVPWLYCDTEGYVTVGVGDKVGPKSVLTMPFVHLANNNGATADEKANAYAKVRKFFHKGFTASAYAAVSDLRLSTDFCRRRLVYRLKNEFVPAIEKHCPQFTSFPLMAKLVLVDIAYNVGVDSKIKGFAAFTQLIADCNARQFDKAAYQVHTKKDDEDPKDVHTWGKRNWWRYVTMAVA